MELVGCVECWAVTTVRGMMVVCMANVQCEAFTFRSPSLNPTPLDRIGLPTLQEPR